MCLKTVLRFCLALKETFSNSITFTVINNFCKSAVVQIPTVFQVGLPCCLSKGPLKGNFLDIYLITFLGIRNFENKFAMRVMIFLKMFKI